MGTAALAVSAAWPAAAPGLVAHSVAPGESLWSIASRDGLSVSQLALANGLSSAAQLHSGSVLQIPGRILSAAPTRAVSIPAPSTRALSRVATTTHSLSAAPHTSASDDGGNDPDDSRGASAAGIRVSAPPPLGGYTVRPGDSLSELALRSRVSVGEIAYMNGLNPNAPLRIGTLIKLPTGAPTPTRAVEAVPARRVVPAAGPYPTPARVSLGEIQGIAAREGVPSSLAAAIAWQESGFNNGLVSSANARGVMQLLPGTWDWVQRTLVGHPLDPSSPRDNVAAGVLYLHSLLRSSGGNPTTATAAYYQGLGSVRRIGLLPETQRYVASVAALRNRFGGR
ncbi:MAG TPA: LysM peptidoglycan-binding domain-containing protein [Solirubrobacteraceae bacterium]|nr:LysM peptidoglycan-binding domain-containing protein [Solirubrobacteraceae bacterium]